MTQSYAPRRAARGCPIRKPAVESLESRVLMAVVPGGFADATYVAGINSATSMAFAPDGRLFVTQQGGQMRVVTRNAAGAGTLQATPFLTVSTDLGTERGLLGVALSPDFPATGHVFVYYTVPQTTRFNRISRFTAADADPSPDVYAPGNVAAPGSELVVMNLDPLSSATNHNGGAMHFGPDGKLYVAVGDNANGSHSQNFANRHGKMLRINPDGSIPADNPFLAQTTGVNRAIWAMGLRNPYTFAFQPGTGRMFINDVGDNGPDDQKWEEINEGAAGRNYGWPATGDGYFDPAAFPNFTNPLHAYNHTTGGRAITGGVFYNPAVQNFPSAHVGDYFFADYAGNFIRKLEAPVTGQRLPSGPFATNAANPVDLDVGPEGHLYYLARGSGTVGRIRYTASLAPAIGTQPANRMVSQGQSATFTVSASGDAPLGYQWQRAAPGGAFADIPDATAASYATAATTSADDGARFRVVVTNAHGSATSNEAILTVTVNQPPAPVITSPLDGATFAAGELITFAGSATDPEDGAVPASRLRWEILYYTSTANGTGGVRRPFSSATGVAGGEFRVADTGPYSNADVFYRIELTAEDAQGLTTTVVRDIQPRTSGVTIATNVPGLTLNLDGQPQAAPYSFVGVEGFKRQLEAPATQTVNGATYEFVSWSQGGERSQEIATPADDATYTATYRQVAQTVVGRHVFYNNSAFDGRNVGANAADDGAVATDKAVLLPGQKASFSNITSYSRGINGLMVDVANLPETATITSAQFAFATGNGDGNWVEAPAPAAVALRRGAGVGGSARVTLTWGDNRIANTWLRVAFTTGGPPPLDQDVFYVGNLRGETGDLFTPVPDRLAVSGFDPLRTRAAIGTGAVLLNNPYDHNRDGRVNARDYIESARNRGRTLALITVPPLPPTAPSIAADSRLGRRLLR